MDLRLIIQWEELKFRYDDLHWDLDIEFGTFLMMGFKMTIK